MGSNLSLEAVLLIVGMLLAICVVSAKFATKLGVPVLIAFVGLGMLAGSDGPGGIYFADAQIAQRTGTVCLLFILFAGGMDLHWHKAKSRVAPALALSSIGVVITAICIGAASHALLKISMMEALLLGAIVSSTDAAAIFSVLPRGEPRLKQKIHDIIELESGTNDPTAIFLTSALISVVQSGNQLTWSVAGHFVWEMLLGGFGGWLFGRAGVIAMRKVRLHAQGLFHVVSIALVLISFGAIALMKGNGFLAVYVAGVTFGNGDFSQVKGLRRFHDGIAWIMQMAMFFVLGLLVFPSKLPEVALVGIALALILIFLARPIGVHIALLPFRMRYREQAMVAWCGLRGAVAILLATYPLLAGLPNAAKIFDVVFVIVLATVLIQGTTLKWIMVKLGQTEPTPQSADSLPAQSP
ncbi:MAG: potassium/proton antiporter [Chthonomonas sp.]|nr:potassium/proton antiporter [Chthonomonas sp.]